MAVLMWLLIAVAVLTAGVAVLAFAMAEPPRALHLAEWNPWMWLAYAAAFACWALAASDALSSGLADGLLVIAGVALLMAAELLGRRSRRARTLR